MEAHLWRSPALRFRDIKRKRVMTNHATEPCPLYPLFLRLENQPVLVVGAGAVAQRKIDTLLQSGARITVVSPHATDHIAKLADQGSILWHRRTFQPEDPQGALLVVSATGQPEVDQQVYAHASQQHALINVVDVPDLCNAFVPSVLRRGRLQIAVSTSGAAPSLARDIRHDLEGQFSPEWEEYLDLLAQVRLIIKERVGGTAADRAVLYESVVASGLLARIQQGEHPDPETVFSQVCIEACGQDASPEADALPGNDALLGDDALPGADSTPGAHNQGGQAR